MLPFSIGINVASARPQIHLYKYRFLFHHLIVNASSSSTERRPGFYTILELQDSCLSLIMTVASIEVYRKFCYQMQDWTTQPSLESQVLCLLMKYQWCKIISIPAGSIDFCSHVGSHKFTASYTLIDRYKL